MSRQVASSLVSVPSRSRSMRSMPIRPPVVPGSWRLSMTVEVIKPGLATSVQDLGRPGYYHLGIPESGAMDRYALRAANLLVGNDEGDAALEATFQGPELRFNTDAVVAVTGA